MKRYKKTYAIYNLTEKHTSFFLGKTRVQVSFTGGIVTKKGVTPATFTTEDAVVQFAIENSADYKNGTVTLRSRYPLPGEVKVGKNIRAEETPEPTGGEDSPTEETPEPTGGEDSPTDDTPADDRNVEETSATPVESTPAGATMAEKAEEKTGAPEVVEVSCRDVAKQYLQEHYGENLTPLRTIANIQECAAKYGITFSFV